MTACPKCSAPLAGLATFCHSCKAYTADMIEGEAKAPRVAHSGIEQAETRPEVEIRMAIRRALEASGFDVYDFEQNRPTRQTPGIADLYAVGRGRCAWIEVKTHKGKQSEAQVVFERRVTGNGGEYLVMRHESEAFRWAEDIREAVA